MTAVGAELLLGDRGAGGEATLAPPFPPRRCYGRHEGRRRSRHRPNHGAARVKEVPPTSPRTAQQPSFAPAPTHARAAPRRVWIRVSCSINPRATTVGTVPFGRTVGI